MSIIEKLYLQNILIETDRLKIYPIKQDKKILLDLFEIYANPDNVKNYCNVAPNFDIFYDYQNRKIQEHQIDFQGMISFVFELKGNSKIIGLRNLILDAAYVKVGNPRMDSLNLITEIIVHKDYWKKEIASEASKAIFQILKENGVENILSLVSPKNTYAISLDKKLGFKETSYFQAYFTHKFHRDFKIHSSNNDDIIFVNQL